MDNTSWTRCPSKAEPGEQALQGTYPVPIGQGWAGWVERVWSPFALLCNADDDPSPKRASQEPAVRLRQASVNQCQPVPASARQPVPALQVTVQTGNPPPPPQRKKGREDLRFQCGSIAWTRPRSPPRGGQSLLQLPHRFNATGHHVSNRVWALPTVSPFLPLREQDKILHTWSAATASLFCALARSLGWLVGCP